MVKLPYIQKSNSVSSQSLLLYRMIQGEEDWRRNYKVCDIGGGGIKKCHFASDVLFE